MKSAKADKGFSLVEMLVVLAIVSLIGIFGLNGYSAHQNNGSLRVVTQQIQSMAALSSLRAVTNGATVSLEIDVTKKIIYSGQNSPPIIVPGPFKLTVLTGAELIQQDSIALIDFYNDGTSSGGEITIEDGNGAEKTIRILWLTGAIDIKGET
jgi:general secretion pathway protein H